MPDVKPIPDNYPRLSPYLVVEGAAQAIDWYTEIFDATERGRVPSPGGQIGHAELEIGDSLLMLSDPFPEGNAFGPKHVGGTPVMLTVYVDDVDSVFVAAVAAGATALREPGDQFYGDRASQVEDPFGHRWAIATHIEDVSHEEMARRSVEMFGE